MLAIIHQLNGVRTTVSVLFFTFPSCFQNISYPVPVMSVLKGEIREKGDREHTASKELSSLSHVHVSLSRTCHTTSPGYKDV